MIEEFSSNMILTIFFLYGLIQHGLTIKCFTCSDERNFCSIPLTIDAGEENNENDIDSYEYGFGYYCQSDHYIDLQTGLEKIILNGVSQCEELDIPNHRRYCCSQDNCNKDPPLMQRISFIPSNKQQQQTRPLNIIIIFCIVIFNNV